MKMKSILLALLALLMTVSLCACGSDSAPADDTTTTVSSNVSSTTAVTTTTTMATTTTTTTVAEGKVTYSVTVTDEAGNPIPGAYVQLCLESCLPCMTNEQGVATWPNFDEADYKVSFISIPEGYSSDVDAFYFEKGSYEMTIVLKAVA